MESILRFVKRCIPTALFRSFLPAYHFFLAFSAALYYRFPSRKIFVVAVTGTNGKTTVTEIVNAFLEEAGRKTALSNTLRFKVGTESFMNVFKMTTPGRFFLQRFLREAVDAQCRYAIIELTSEGARQSRHLFVALDALIFTNLTPEHIESHGSFEKYRDAKRKLARALARSGKPKKYMVANIDDPEGKNFLRIAGRGGAEKIPYSRADAAPYAMREGGVSLSLEGETVESSLPGLFSIANILAAAAFARSQGISVGTIQKALRAFRGVPGRVERVSLSGAGVNSSRQNFSVYVDYAHTPDALQNLYEAFPNTRKICVLGATGGGRDKWKRPELGRIAAEHCAEIILTDEDPYDENPETIINDVASGVSSHAKFKIPNLSSTEPQVLVRDSKFHIILDRRRAIADAVRLARAGDAVFITGKGTDPYIMGPRGTKIPWSDAEIVREALGKVI